MAVSTGNMPRRRWQRKLSRDLYQPVKVFFAPTFPPGSSTRMGRWTKSMDIFSVEFLSALLAIVVIDLVLAGDNAIVIALAARSLPATLQKKAIVWGTVGAIVVRAAMVSGQERTVVRFALCWCPWLRSPCPTRRWFGPSACGVRPHSFHVGPLGESRAVR